MTPFDFFLQWWGLPNYGPFSQLGPYKPPEQLGVGERGAVDRPAEPPADLPSEPKGVGETRHLSLVPTCDGEHGDVSMGVVVYCSDLQSDWARAGRFRKNSGHTHSHLPVKK